MTMASLQQLGAQAAGAITGWNGATVPLQVVAFSAGDFDPSAFAAHGIACPAHIARSVRKRQAEFFAGRMAARRALARYGLEDREIGTGRFREPLWPQGMTGSITHHQRLAAAVALPQQAGCGIGIDLETIASGEAQRALAQIAVSAGELAYLESVGGGLPLGTLLSVAFSAKESFFKAAFPMVGGYFGFDAVRVLHIDVARRRIRLLVRQPLCAQLAPGTEVGAAFMLVDGDAVFTSCCLQPAG